MKKDGGTSTSYSKEGFLNFAPSVNVSFNPKLHTDLFFFPHCKNPGLGSRVMRNDSLLFRRIGILLLNKNDLFLILCD